MAQEKVPYMKHFAAANLGCVLTETGKASDAIQAISAAMRAIGATVWSTSWLSRLALAYAELGKVDDASLIGRLRSSAFRLSTSAVSMSLAGSRFSSESAPRPFQHGVRRRGGTISYAALPSRTVGPSGRATHLIHRPTRDIIPPLGGARVSCYRVRSCRALHAATALALGPAELGAVNPYAVHDHSQPACQATKSFGKFAANAPLDGIWHLPVTVRNCSPALLRKERTSAVSRSNSTASIAASSPVTTGT